MSDPNQEFQAPPPPPVPPQPQPAARPVKLRPVAIVVFVLGVLLILAGLIRLVPGPPWTGAAFAFWGILLFAFSFIPLPKTDSAAPPLSALAKIPAMFYEPSRVFKNLRAHPHWLGAFLVVTISVIIYSAAFVQKVTPERIVDFTMKALEESPFKPPPEAMAKAREDALQQAKQPIQRVQTAARSFVSIFVLASFLAGLYLLIVLAFGGRINFWQAFSATLYSMVPIVLLQKALSLVILLVKDPEDIHPILNQETLVWDNLGTLLTPSAHPVLFVLASAIGLFSLWGLWLRATGLRNAGTKVSSSAAWGAALTLWILGILFGTVIAALFPSFFG